MKKRITALLLVFSLVAGLPVFTSSAEQPVSDISWYDSSQSEFIITTPSQLLGIASVGTSFSGKTIKLGADITLNEGDAASWGTKIPEIVWTPISGFAGTFDGQGHTISGMYCRSANDAGMFKGTSANALIKDFRLVNSYFATTSGTSAAAVSCYGGGTFEKIYSDAVVRCADHHAGGIFGVATSSVTARECWFDGIVTMHIRYAAGIVGNGNGQTVLIEHCLNSGEIYTSRSTGSNAHIGGICGRNDASTTITDCLNTGRIHSAMTDAGANDVLGSIFGACSGNINENGVWTSKVNISTSWATDESCVSLVGNNVSEDPTQQTDYNGIPLSQLTGYSAYHNTTLDFVNYWAVVTDGTPVPKCFADDVPGSSTSGPIAPDTSWYDASLSEFVITTPAQLLGIASVGANFSGKTVKLGADIVFNEGSAANWASSIPKNLWTPITGFAGTFDGQGHTVSGLYCVLDSGVGMFKATAAGSLIKDFRLVNSYFEAATGTAAAAVSCSGGGTFEKIYSDAVVRCADHHAGGIFGIASSNVTARECWFDGKVTIGIRYAAGIVGNGNGQTVLIEHCLNSGEIYTTRNTGSNAHIGGICGRNDASTTIVDCLNIGRIHSAMTDANQNDLLGSIFGACVANTNENGVWTSKVNISTSWATNESCGTLIGVNLSEDPTQQTDYNGIPLSQLAGYNAYHNTTLDFANYWAVVPNGAPIPKCFADDVPGADPLGPIAPDTSWYDSSLSEFVITTPAQLLGIAYVGSNFSGKTIKLGADITFNEGDASSWASSIPKNIWTPIPNFAGTFDGQGHTVSGLYCVLSGGVGMFKGTAAGSLIKNFRLVNSYFAAISGTPAAAISCSGGGTFEKIYSNAVVHCTEHHAGGIFGIASSNVTARECWFDGKVTIGIRYAAGIVGNGNGQTVLIEHCLNSGEIYTSRSTGSNAHIGGICGRNDASTTIVDCLNTGRIHSAMTDANQNDLLGSIFGACVENYNENGVWTSKVNITTSWATNESCGTLIGVNLSEDPTQLTDYNGIPASQLAGYNAYHNTTLDFANHWSVVSDGTPVPKCFADIVTGAAENPLTPDTSWYDASLSEFVITTPAQLLGMATLGVNFSGKTVKLGADITFNTGSAASWANTIPRNIWTPITGFAGTFDGQGHTVSGLYCVLDSGVGMFKATAAGSLIKDFRLVNSYFEAATGTAAAAVSCSGGGTFEKIYSDAVVRCADHHAGGIFGAVSSSVTVRECWFDGKVTIGMRYAAGIVGNGNGKTVLIEHCLNSGEIYTTRSTGSNAHIGGICGRNDASTTIVDCLNTGRIHSAMTDANQNDLLGSIFGACVANTNENGVWTSKVNITTSWATNESCGTLIGVNLSEDPTQQTDYNGISASKLVSDSSYCYTTLDFANYWSVVKGGSPVPTCFADMVTGARPVNSVSPDTSWYNSSLSEFVITTPAQLLGIAYVGSNFSGKTIKLGADITFNTGSAASWATSAPNNVWKPIQNFAGTFDGQGYTVSGLYYSAGTCAGMFYGTAAGALIKDLRLVNSYFETTAGTSAAAISCSGGGTFEKIYTDALVHCADHHAGGILGVASSSVTARECWFDGKVTMGMRYGAGIVGNGNGQTVLIEHCLNSGEIYTQTTGANAHIGGICGRNDASTTIVDCLNTGLVHSAVTDAGSKDVLGALFGACAGNTNANGVWTSKLNVTGSWATCESCDALIGANSSKDPSQQKDCSSICANQLTGYGGYYNTTLDFQTYWAVDPDGAPILKYFADTVPVLYDLPAPGISDAEVTAGQNYGPKWTVTLNVPQGFSKSDITVGVLICATKAIPQGQLLYRSNTGFEYRGATYPVIDMEAVSFLPSGNDTIIAEFVLTGLDATNIRTNYSVRPYAVYTLSDGEAEVYGATKNTTFYTEAKTLEAGTLKDQIDAALAPIDAVIGSNFAVSKDWSTMDLFEEVPALLASGSTILPAEDYGVGNYVIEVSGVSGVYSSYVALLESCGFTKVVDNGSGLKGAVFTANLVKGDLMLCVTEIPSKNKVYISAMWDQPLSEHLLDDFRNTVVPGAVTTLHQKDLYWWGDCYIIQLKNSHFIVVDGATDYELGYLLDYLESLVAPGEKPVIEAWCNTHLHLDHFYILKKFLDHPDWVDRVYVEGFYFSEPSNAVKDIDPGVYAEIAKEHLAIDTLKTTAGTTPEIYRPQTGQRYYFCDVTMDIMLSQEQMPISAYVGGFNESSTWYLFTMEGQTFLEGGDGHQGNMNFIMTVYKPADLRVDFFSVLHHSYNTWDVFTNWVGVFRTVLYPTTAAEKAGVLAQARHINLNSKALEYFFAGEGTDVFYLPYTPGTTGTNGGHVKLPPLPEHHS